MAKSKKQKEVTILARVQFKADSRKVVYQCLSSDGQTVYHTYLFNGKATSCECSAHKPCKHMAACQAKEQARQPKSEPTCQGMVPENYRETSSLSSNRAFSILR